MDLGRRNINELVVVVVFFVGAVIGDGTGIGSDLSGSTSTSG
jgi:hypothetical protein